MRQQLHSRLATCRFPAYTSAMPERIGDFTIRMGSMNQSQVDEVARAKASGDKRHFGDIAVALGFIKAAEVEAFLAAQK